MRFGLIRTERSSFIWAAYIITFEYTKVCGFEALTRRASSAMRVTRVMSVLVMCPFLNSQVECGPVAALFFVPRCSVQTVLGYVVNSGDTMSV